MPSIRALLVDDHEFYLEALGEVLEEMDVVVVGLACSAEEALQLADLHHPDLAIVDSVLGDEDGIELAARLRSRHPLIRVIVTADAEDVNVASAVRAVRAGARAFLPKAIPIAEVNRVAHSILSGETHIPPVLLTGVLATLTGGALTTEDEQDRLAALSTREFDVLVLLAAGRDTAAIAEQLFLSPHTVRTHVKHVLAKLKVHSSLEAVALLLRSGRSSPAQVRNSEP
jgi:DNA-binding NarL/FixJ family response regulator